jgi:PAS domain S-box-containing protein
MVEDSEDSCLLLAEFLHKHDYQPTWRRVEDAKGMRQAMTDQPWDIVIADYVVPGFDAFASLELAQELGSDLPFIVVSGNLGEETAVQLMKAGAQDYVNKANLARLIPAIQRELREATGRRARREAEQALQQKEVLSRAVLDSLPAEIAVLDQAGKILATNAAWEGLGRGQPQSVRPGTYLDMFRRAPSGGSETKILSGIQEVLQGSRPAFTFEYTRQGQSGMRWFLLHAAPLVQEGGAVVSQIDITESKRAEEALHHSEARFRDVVDSLGEGVLLSDPDDMIWYANSRAGQLTGLDPSSMIEQPAAAVLRSATTTAGLPGAGGPANIESSELELVCKDGRTLWTEVHAAPLRDSHGEVIGTVRAITDISERRKAREALHKSQTSLLLAQRIGHVGSWELDLADRTMEWSAEAYRILDTPAGGPQPDLRQLLELFHPDDRSRVEQAFDTAIRERSSFRSDCRVLRSDSSERSIHLQAQVIFDAADRPVQMIGTVQDITERKRLEEHLRQSQKMDAVGQLAGGVAHDFNNILTVIQGYTELISSHKGLDSQTRTYVNHIATSAERAAKLTRQLLVFSRKQLIQLKTLNVNELLSNSSAMLQRLLGEQSQLTLNVQPNLPLVIADAGMMEQVLVNLVVNARDAMPKGGRLMIETSLHQIDPDYCRLHADAAPGQFVCLGVIDTGCGMDTHTLGHIFEPFFTTKEVGRGTGLGLSTVYGIVKKHQGWIQVASEVGRGSAFKVFLPASANASAATLTPVRGTPAPAGTETILLVEDESPLRKLARGMLERCGYTVIEAGSGPEAVTLWNQTAKVDLLLTDMVMPGGMTGRELAVQLESRSPSLKVLYTSGYSLDFVDSDLLLREGINFVPKPYSGLSLAEAVRACLDRKKGG